MPKKRGTKTERRLTSNQAEWEHQIYNLNRRIKALEKLAYVDFPIPERPDRIYQKHLKAIKAITRKELIKYAYEVDPFTNERVPYVPPKPKRRTRKVASEELEPLPYPRTDKPVAIEDKVLREMEELISTYTGNLANPSLTEDTRAKLMTTLYLREQEIGRAALAQILEQQVLREEIVKQALDESSGMRAKSWNIQFMQMIAGHPFSTTEQRQVSSFLENFEDFSLPQ